jgi:hypothetical protein
MGGKAHVAEEPLALLPRQPERSDVRQTQAGYATVQTNRLNMELRTQSQGRLHGVQFTPRAVQPRIQEVPITGNVRASAVECDRAKEQDGFR